MILLHGRGGNAQSILATAQGFWRPHVAYVAPQAANNTWYPNRFIAPLAANEPWLSWALERVGQVVDLVMASGIPARRIFLLGFSQGGCLALDYAARHPQRYAGVIGFSAGLIGPPGVPWPYAGRTDAPLAETPIFLGCSDVDFHIPLARLKESGETLAALGGAVDLRIYPGMGHTINQDEEAAVAAMIDALG